MPNPFFQQMMNMPMNPVQSLLQQATNVYNTLSDPRAFMRQHFQNVPENYMSSPDQLLQYLQQSGRVTPQQLAFLGQFSCPGR